MRMSFSSLSSSRNGLPTARQLMGSSSLRFQDTSKFSRNPCVIMRGRFDVCNIFEPYKGQQQGIKKIDKLVDGLWPVPVHATYSRSISLKPLAIPQAIREQPLFKTRGLSTVYRLQQFHSMPSCCYREATPPSLDGSEPDKSSRSIHGFHIARICQTNTGFFVERAGRSFTVRPVTFWMDKLLEVEKSKRVSESSTPPPAEHTLVEKTVSRAILFITC